MRSFALALFLATPVAAFAPSVHYRATVKQCAKSKSMPFLEAPAKLDGSMAGDVGFDPLGLSNINDVGLDLYWMREAELKHGRIAMLAAAGALWVELLGSVPGMPEGAGKSQVDVFFNVWAEKPADIGAALSFITVLEVIGGIVTLKGRESGVRAAGDFKFNPLRLVVNNDMETKELSNGRLAMFAAAGILLQGLTTHQGAIANIGN
jgi:light-harvesting complex I chlorophyll a/b binding protein 1